MMTPRGWFAAFVIVACYAPALALEPAHQTVSSRFQRYNVKSFGAKGDGKTPDTHAIAATIRAAAKAGGGTVDFPPGIYRTGTFRLFSNVTLNIEAGAVVMGSSSIDDYGRIEDYGFARHYGVDYTGEGTHVGLIVAENADNVAIVGQGAIDGNSDAFFDFTKPHYSLDFDAQFTRQGAKFMDSVLAIGDGPVAFLKSGRAGTTIVFSHCRNVLLRDFTVRNAPNWTIHFSNVDEAVVEGVHVLNDLRIPNSDGFDCMGCRNVHFSNCEVRTGDDDFAIVSSEDVTVINSSLTSNSSGIRIEDTRSAVFSNLTIHANRGIGVYERGEGKTSGIIFSNISIDTHLLTGHWWGKGEPVYIVIGTAEGNGGSISGVHFSNISVNAENGILLYGDPGAMIRDISFDNIWLHLRVTRKDVNDRVGGNFDLRWTAKRLNNAVFAHDIPAIFGRYVSGLQLTGVQVRWDDAMPDYYSSAGEFEDVNDLMIDRFSGRQATVGSASPVISLSRVQGFSIRNSTASCGASQFLSQSENRGVEFFEGNDLSNATSTYMSETTPHIDVHLSSPCKGTGRMQ